MISINSVDVRKRGKVVFEKFSWQVKAGEHWVIQGANGAGKTTLLELLAGRVVPFSGSVEFDFIKGADPWEIVYQERQRFIHYVPAQALHDVLGFQPDMYYQQRYYSMGNERHPLVRDFFGHDISQLQVLNFPPDLDVTSLLELPLSRLSNGQIRKVTLIRQLLKSVPKVLLMDYPFEGLDSSAREALANFIDHLARDLGIQIILTDHYNHLPQVINRRLILENSRIRQEEVSGSQEIQTEFRENTGLAVSEPIIEMKNVTIRYGERMILENLNWTVRKGERWALTGKNGSGKTTLFSLIYADHPLAYSQEVYLFGRRRGTGESIWDIKNRINYLGPEQAHFLDHRDLSKTVIEYYNGMAKDTTKLDELIAFFGMATLLEKQISQLSSGDLQLVLLVRYFLTQRELLLLDEPFQFLDPSRKAKVALYLSHYLETDSTLVLITHYEADISQWTQLRKRL